MQSEIAAAKTISAISKANPAVATCAAHGYSAGDIVYLEVEGMTQANETPVRVANPDTDSFELEGVDATGYGTFTSGTAKKVTLGTSITTATSVSGSGGDFGFIDITTIHDLIKKQIPDIQNAIVYNMDHLWDMTNAGQIAMSTASKVQTVRTIEFTFRSGRKMYFTGYCGYSGIPTGSAQDKATSQAVFTVNGNPTYYAS